MNNRTHYIRRASAFFLAFMVSFVLASAYAVAFAGTVVTHVHDGDTYLVNASGVTYKVRLWAVDAPEVGQAGCAAARDAAAEMLKGQSIKVMSRGESYGRVVGQVLMKDGTDLSQQLLLEGLVLLDERYSKKLAYREAQAEAKMFRRGLWNTDFTPPWTWRKQHSSRGKVCQ